jgi:hypothetical protein
MVQVKITLKELGVAAVGHRLKLLDAIAAMRKGPGRGLVPGALDLLGADYAVEHEAQRITAMPSTLPRPSGGRSGSFC